MKNEKKLIEESVMVDGKQLLTDVSVSTIFELYEDKEHGIVKGKGPFGKAGVATSNGRLYSVELMKREIGKLQPLLEKRKLYGELDHPGDGRTKLSRVSHLITGLSITEDGTIMGELEVLPTTNGKDLDALIGAACQVDVSSRGFGSVKKTDKLLENGKSIQIVQDDYDLKTWDVVVEGAAGEYSQPRYQKEDDENGEKKPEPIKPEPDPKPEPEPEPEPEPDNEDADKLLVDLRKGNEELKKKILELENDLQVIARGAKKVAYELFLERRIGQESVDIKEEVLELVGDVMLFENLVDLKDKLDKVLKRVKGYRTEIDTKTKEIGEKDKKIEEEKKSGANKQRSALSEKLRMKREFRKNNVVNDEEDYLDYIDENNNGLENDLYNDDEEVTTYLENSDLQNYFARLAIDNDLTGEDVMLLENVFVEEEIAKREDILKLTNRYLRDKKREEIKEGKSIKAFVDDSPEKGLFEDVKTGVAKRKNNKSDETFRTYRDKTEVVTKSGHNVTGHDVLGVPMQELADILTKAKSL